MKILLFGKNGQVGWELNRSLQPLGEIIALGREEADFSRPESLRKVVSETNPDVIVNAVAYTAVDKAEEEEELALIINCDAPRALAEEAVKRNILLVHYSTDYVFDGTKQDPYTEEDAPNPINAYGRTKLAGEKVIQLSGCEYLIFRVSWLYAERGHNFLLSIINFAIERDELSIVSDQIGSPTSAKFVAETTSLCLQESLSKQNYNNFSSGLYHLAATGYASWYGFANEIVKTVANKTDVIKLKVNKISSITTEEYVTAAKRPKNSQLSTVKLQKKFGIDVPDWRELLDDCIATLCNKL